MKNTTNNKTNVPTRKTVPSTTTTKKAPVAVVPTRKVVTKATKAVTKKAPVAVPVTCPNDARIEALADMIRNQNERIEALATQCDVLERIIIGIQTATNAKPAVLAPVAVEALAPAPVVPVAPVAVVGEYAALIEKAVDSVLEGIAAKRFNTNVIPQCPHDLRPYCDTATRKALKAYRTENGITLAVISQHIVEAFERATECVAADYAG